MKSMKYGNVINFTHNIYFNICIVKYLIDESQILFQVNNLKDRLVVLSDMDAKLKRLDEFNGQLKEFDGQLKEADAWLLGGRTRMDTLIKPDKPMEVQERVMATMELQSDVQINLEQFKTRVEFWEGPLKPTESGENTEEAQVNLYNPYK